MTFTARLIRVYDFFLMTLSRIPRGSRRIRGLDPSRPGYKYWVFGAISVGLLGSAIDHGSVNVALPSIAEHFKTDLPSVQWVVIGYALTISALLLPMGKLADQIGRKKLYVLGILVFVVGAVAAGSSSSLIMLILSRISQGVGAAMTQGVGMAIITSAFPPSERGKAIGLIMTVIGAGSVAGPAVGGIIVGVLDWPYVFYFSVPLGLTGLAASLVVLEERRTTHGSQSLGTKFDWLGAGLSTGALVTLLVAMTNGHRSGWTSPPIIVALLGSVTMVTTFIWWELRTSNPLLDLRLFQRRTFSFGILAAFLTFLGSSSVLFLMPFYLQGVLGFSPKLSGLIVMPGAFCMALVGPLSGTLSDRYGWRWFTVGGLASSAAGVFLLSTLTEDSSLSIVFPALILTSIGMGAFYSPNTSSVLGTVELEKYSIVSSLLGLVRNGANIISLALATAVIAATMASMGFEPSLEAVREATGADEGHAFSVGLRNAFLVMLGLLLGAMAVSAFKGEKVKELRAVEPRKIGQGPD